MTRLGIRQLELLRFIGTDRALLTPDRMSDRLIELGLLQSDRPNGAAYITPNGLRALADAAEKGRIRLFVPPTQHIQDVE